MPRESLDTQSQTRRIGIYVLIRRVDGLCDGAYSFENQEVDGRRRLIHAAVLRLWLWLWFGTASAASIQYLDI